MSRRALRLSLAFMVVLAVAAVGISVVSHSKPTLGLDLQGGFSVVLQAKPVNGVLPSEESVEKAKDIIRQRVDGLGVAEPDITRQGRTVIVQLPGVKNREKAESVVGCTARLEFRPVLSVAVNPDFVPPSTEPDGDGSTTTTSKGTTTTAGSGATTTTVPATTTTVGGEGEGGFGTVGAAPGEGALPSQFAPTTTTTTPPTTTSTAPPATTTTVAPAPTTTSVPGDATTTTVAGASGGETSSCSGGAAGGSSAGTTTTTVAPAVPGSITVPSDSGSALYTLGPLSNGFTGDSLSSATAVLGDNGGWAINVSVKGSRQARANAAFNPCAAGDPTTCPPQNNEGQGAIAIVLDNVVLSAPAVQSQDLASDTFTISGDFDEGEAKDLALVLRYGSLPVEFEQAALQQVSATLGADSLRAGLVAGLLGVAVLGLYMILYYRGFGWVVVVSLVIWSALMYGLLNLLSAQQGLALTLAGITGIIVSVGTTVDTYVVVFERIKDELREGRSVRAATERGYESGIKTVFTANGAAFIGAFLLWWLTVGPVRGFAYFLGLSVILDLAVAVLFTRPLILLLGRSPRFARARFFGIGTSTDQAALSKEVVA